MSAAAVLSAPVLRFVAVSQPMMRAVDLAARVSSSPSTTVLVEGEPGSGRALIARLIHQRTRERADRPFVTVSCLKAPEWLLDAQLFGRGAADGALGEGAALSRAAAGTLFLEDAGELTPDGQDKLLSLLRVAAALPAERSVRVIASASPDLAAEVRRGAFRPDLYQELAVFHIEVAPLRERRDDILPLARQFLEEDAARLHRPLRRLHAESETRLRSHDFPGNVRELHNVIERAILLETGPLISPTSIILHATAVQGATPTSASHPTPRIGPQGRPPTLAEVERDYLEQLLEYTRGNRTMTARLMGVSYPTVMKKITDYGVDITKFKISPPDAGASH